MGVCVWVGVSSGVVMSPFCPSPPGLPALLGTENCWGGSGRWGALALPLHRLADWLACLPCPLTWREGRVASPASLSPHPKAQACSSPRRALEGDRAGELP